MQKLLLQIAFLWHPYDIDVTFIIIKSLLFSYLHIHSIKPYSLLLCFGWWQAHHHRYRHVSSWFISSFTKWRKKTLFMRRQITSKHDYSYRRMFYNGQNKWKLFWAYRASQGRFNLIHVQWSNCIDSIKLDESTFFSANQLSIQICETTFTIFGHRLYTQL